MPINFVTGLPRQGKTLFTFVQVQERQRRENRPVFYCNIPEVTPPGWAEIDHPDKWMDCPNDSIIVVDDLQDFWAMAPAGSKVPHPILELSKHGKRGIDFYFITQDPTLVHATPRKLCEVHWHVVRAFGSENAVAHKFNRMQTDPEKVKSKSEKYPWRYPKEAFGKKDKAGNWITRPWYKSADVHNIKRKVPLKVWAIPGALVLAGLAVWAGVHVFGGVLERAKGATGSQQAASDRGPQGAAQPPTVQPAGPVSTLDYLRLHAPRLPDLPHTAPLYDEVTKPVTAPRPAACVLMGKRCECYSQQATVMRMGGDVCRQIVAHGYFQDWRDEGAARQDGSQVHPSGDQQAPKVVHASVPAVAPSPPGDVTVADISAGRVPLHKRPSAGQGR